MGNSCCGREADAEAGGKKKKSSDKKGSAAPASPSAPPSSSPNNKASDKRDDDAPADVNVDVNVEEDDITHDKAEASPDRATRGGPAVMFTPSAAADTSTATARPGNSSVGPRWADEEEEEEEPPAEGVMTDTDGREGEEVDDVVFHTPRSDIVSAAPASPSPARNGGDASVSLDARFADTTPSPSRGAAETAALSPPGAAQQQQPQQGAEAQVVFAVALPPVRWYQTRGEVHVAVDVLDSVDVELVVVDEPPAAAAAMPPSVAAVTSIDHGVGVLDAAAPSSPVAPASPAETTTLLRIIMTSPTGKLYAAELRLYGRIDRTRSASELDDDGLLRLRLAKQVTQRALNVRLGGSSSNSGAAAISMSSPAGSDASDADDEQHLPAWFWPRLTALDAFSNIKRDEAQWKGVAELASSSRQRRRRSSSPHGKAEENNGLHSESNCGGGGGIVLPDQRRQLLALSAQWSSAPPSWSERNALELWEGVQIERVAVDEAATATTTRTTFEHNHEHGAVVLRMREEDAEDAATSMHSPQEITIQQQHAQAGADAASFVPAVTGIHYVFSDPAGANIDAVSAGSAFARLDEDFPLLRELQLWNAGSGDIGAEFFGHLPPRLQLLDLRSTKGSKLSCIAPGHETAVPLHLLPHTLTSLNLSGNNMRGAEIDWSSLRYAVPLLQELLLSNCQLRGACDLRGLPSTLRSLDITVNDFRGVTDIGGMPATMRTARLGGNPRLQLVADFEHTDRLACLQLQWFSAQLRIFTKDTGDDDIAVNVGSAGGSNDQQQNGSENTGGSNSARAFREQQERLVSAAVDARARKAIADVTAAGEVEQESSGQRRREQKKDAAAVPVLSPDELAAYKQLLTDSLLTISLQASFSEHAGVASAPSFEALHRQQLQQSLFDLMLVMR